MSKFFYDLRQASESPFEAKTNFVFRLSLFNLSLSFWTRSAKKLSPRFVIFNFSEKLQNIFEIEFKIYALDYLPKFRSYLMFNFDFWLLLLWQRKNTLLCFAICTCHYKLLLGKLQIIHNICSYQGSGRFTPTRGKGYVLPPFDWYDLP